MIVVYLGQMAKRQIIPVVLIVLWVLCLMFIWLWDPETPDPIPNPDPPALGMASPLDPERTELADAASRDHERRDLTAGPIDNAMGYVQTMQTYAPPTPTPTPVPTPEPTSNPGGGSVGGGAVVIDCGILNPDLELVCNNESSGSTHAYNADGCLGGCWGIFQMSGEYMDGWAQSAGYPDYAYAGFWPADVQIAVANWMYSQPGGLETYWCGHTDYC